MSSLRALGIDIESIINPDWGDLIQFELQQLKEEGKDLTLIDGSKLIRKAKLGGKNAAEEAWSLLQKLPTRKDYPYYEPSELDEIRRTRPRSKYEIQKIPKNELKDKILGGFFGRCAGNMLGKPVELMDRNEILARMRKLNLSKLENYFPKEFFSDDELKIAERYKTVRENIKCVARDDDIDYVLLNLKVVEKYGKSFSSADIGKEWLANLPYDKVYTAERMAYRNLVNGLKPPQTAMYLNPFREWIGAQIRADLWGYICPGNPELAAELAYRDARLSHVKNGVYGEMFVAAMIAQSFIEENTLRIIEVGLSQIPVKCRLREAISYVIDLWKKGIEWEKAIEDILDKFSNYNPIHTINNAAIVAAALLWGEGDFGATITKAVLSGLDTDCNGATVGSIIGVMQGYSRMKEKDKRVWFDPLDDLLESAIPEFHKASITNVVERIVNLAENIV